MSSKREKMMIKEEKEKALMSSVEGYLRILTRPGYFTIAVAVIYLLILVIDFININMGFIPYDTDIGNVNGVADFEIFRGQARIILDGGFVYHDANADSPPLMIYLLTVPYIIHLISGLRIETCYKGYYAAFAVLISVMALEVYKRHNREITAVILGIFTAFHPFMLVFTFWSASDELIATFIVISAVYFLERKNYQAAAVLAGLAFQTKYYPAIIGIYVLARAKGLLLQLKVIMLAGITAVTPFIPFLLIEPEFYRRILGRFAGMFDAYGTGLFAALDKIGWLRKETVDSDIFFVILIIIMSIVASYILLSSKRDPAFYTLGFVAFHLLYPQFYAAYILNILIIVNSGAFQSKNNLFFAIAIPAVVSITAISSIISNILFLISSIVQSAVFAGWMIKLVKKQPEV